MSYQTLVRPSLRYFQADSPRHLKAVNPVNNCYNAVNNSLIRTIKSITRLFAGITQLIYGINLLVTLIGFEEDFLFINDFSVN